MSALLEQLKNRRKALGLKQKDMMFRVGVSRQQYQRLESKGNPRLNTLELIAKGLNSRLLLVPQEKLAAVQAVLRGDNDDGIKRKENQRALVDDPWKGLLGDEE